MAADDKRVRQICERLEAVQECVAQACQRAGRTPGEVTLVAVTKTFPHCVVAAAQEAGLQDLAENKVQELTAKAQAFPSVRWHMIGHLQRNKARDAVAHAHVFHALDSLRLARALSTRAGQAERVLPCFVQVNVSGEESKFGVPVAQVGDFLCATADLPHLSILGLMTLAAPAARPDDVRPQFRLLRTLLETWSGFPQRPLLSMGMSSDFEVAIEEGATHIRLGSVLFGSRS